MLKVLVSLWILAVATAHDDWSEKCPDPLHMEESQRGAFRAYDLDDNGAVTLEEVSSVYNFGVDDEDAIEGGLIAAKHAFAAIDKDESGDLSEWEFQTANMNQLCVGPAPSNGSGCPPPYIWDGEADFFKLKAEHYELRPLTWIGMSRMENNELRDFLRSHDVPFSVRIKVLDLHDAKGGKKNKECVPVPPSCHGALEFHPSDGTCRPPKAHYLNPIIDDAWISPVSVVDGHHHNEKAPRAHQPVQNDPNDQLMVKDRHAEENSLWNWEKIRRHTAH